MTLLKRNAAPSLKNALSLRTLTVLLVLVGTMVFLVAIVARHVNYAYTSDDVGIQNILSSWRSGQELQPIVGFDTFILKWPFYLFADLLLPASRTQLLVTVVAFAGIQAAGLILFVLFVHRRFFRGSRAALVALFVPVLWFMSSQIVVPSVNDSYPSLFVPNGRNAEVAAALLIVYLATKLFDLPSVHRRHAVPIALVGMGLGLLAIHDPYWLYVFGPAVAIVATILFYLGRTTPRHLIAVLCTAAVGVASTAALSATTQALGIRTLHNAPRSILAAGDLADAAANTLSVYLINFNATLFGRHLDIEVVPAMINFVLAAAGLWAVFSSIRRVRRSKDAAEMLLLVSSGAAVTLFTLTSASSDLGHRFLYVLTFLLLPLIGISLTHALARGLPRLASRTMAIVVALAIMVNLGFNIRELTTGLGPDRVYPQAADVETVSALEAQHITKVYGDYWHTSVLTYFSQRAVVALPVNCSKEGIGKKNWLTNLPDYALESVPTAYVWGPRDACSLDQVADVLGEPDRSTTLAQGTRVLLIYKEDIGQRID